ncbi:unnamed protein product [Moneuplotes crassus]|uniref:Nop domain-containing protein n=1 Tax=Euplotes crassus TaxID=5936 RepID=A0AAD1UAL9_EUPCR|nr:unnamed protein product [Moneuplotes crassus]
MRLKEWFSWHFPELVKIVTDNSIYALLVHLIGNRENINEALLPKLEEITLDEEKAKEIIEANNASMGQDISENDTAQIKMFSSRIVEMVNYRTSLGEYLHNRMLNVAPNLSALIGDNVGAKLISQAGSLVNLAKYSASTIQILGAEKALFRSLKQEEILQSMVSSITVPLFQELESRIKERSLVILQTNSLSQPDLINLLSFQTLRWEKPSRSKSRSVSGSSHLVTSQRPTETSWLLFSKSSRLTASMPQLKKLLMKKLIKARRGSSKEEVQERQEREEV